MSDRGALEEVNRRVLCARTEFAMGHFVEGGHLLTFALIAARRLHAQELRTEQELRVKREFSYGIRAQNALRKP